MRLADAVLRAVEEPVEFKFLYDVKVSAKLVLILIFEFKALFTRVRLRS